MFLDIWVHHHRHGFDTYTMFRQQGEPVHEIEEVIEAHNIDFEEDREEEYLEVRLTSIEVPSNFTPSELGDLQFAMRAQRNRLDRAIFKKDAASSKHFAANSKKFKRYEKLLNKLKKQEKLCVSPKENV